MARRERNPEKQALHTAKAKGEISHVEYRRRLNQINRKVGEEKQKAYKKRVQKSKGLFRRIREFMSP